MEQPEHHFKIQMQAFKANTVRTMTNPRMGVPFDSSRRTKQKAFIQNWIRDLKQVTAELSQLRHLAWFIKNNIPVPARLKTESNQLHHSRIVREVASLYLNQDDRPLERDEKTPLLIEYGGIHAFKPSNKLFA